MKKIIKNNFLLYSRYFKYEPLYCILRLFAEILVIVPPISSIYLFQLFLDAIFIDKDLKRGIMISVFTASINLATAVINWWMNNKSTPVSEQKNNLRYTKEVLDIYLSTDIDIIEDPKFYDKYTQVINDITKRVMAVQTAVTTLIGNLFSLGIIIALMVRIGPMMVLISMIGVLANLIMAPIMNKLGFASYTEKTPLNRKQDYIKRVFYLRDYAKDLKLYKISDLFLHKIDENNDEILKVIRKFGNRFIFCGIVISLIQCLSFASVLAYLAFCAIFKNWTIGYVASMFNASNELKDVMGKIFETLPSFDENNRYIENYNALIRNSASVIEASGKEKSSANGEKDFSSIEFKNVDFTYKNAVSKALDSISLKFEKGKKYALVGHNGAGKSTLINLMIRLYDPSNGTITLNGKDYKAQNINELRSLFNVVLQNCQVYALSIAENILMRESKGIEDEAAVWKALEIVGIKEYVQHLPNGINTILTKEFTEEGIVLSGGQMQKMLFARTFVNDAPIILLDEVTSAMDAISEDDIYNKIEKYAVGKTLIYISHKLSTTKDSDCIYVFHNGRIAENGTHKQLMKLGGIYRDMFTVQAEKYN